MFEFRLFGREIFRAGRPAPNKRSGYLGAKLGNLTSDWVMDERTGDEILRADLATLRSRSRDLWRNNDYAKAFGRLLVTNVVGPKGIQLRNNATEGSAPDVVANRIIETAWRRWGKRGECSVSRNIPFKALCAQALETVARDGEAFIRKVKGFDNTFGFALQLIEPDLVNHELNYFTRDGNRVRMGIEVDQWDAPIAYHFLTAHPGESSLLVGGRHYDRIPADEIIHLFDKKRPTQRRGAPWLASSMLRLRHLGAFEEATLVNKRVTASKMGFIKSPAGDAYTGDDEDADGNQISEVAPGVIEQLSGGEDFIAFDPKFDASDFQPFVKAMLRGVAAGGGPSYSSLAQDLESVNYSSLRAGALDERDYYRILQDWFVEHFLEEVFPDWLRMAFLSGQLDRLPLTKFDKFNAPTWQPRGWGWVDPAKEVKAKLAEINGGLNSRSRILAEQGIDFADLVAELKAEQELLEASGVKLDFSDIQELGGDNGDT